MAVRVSIETEQLLQRRSTENGSEEPSSAVATDSSNSSRIKHIFKSWWKKAVIVSAPLVLLPIPVAIQTQPSYAFYAIAIIAIYWITEALPLAATSLLPLVLFPALGVLSADIVASNYLSDANMLFVGGLIVAVAIEKWNLHKRIALLVLLCISSKPKWLLLGFMCVTAFLSMWISNTATAAMMLPISHAVLQEIRQQSSNDRGNQSGRGTEQEGGRGTSEEGGDGDLADASPGENLTLVSAKFIRKDSNEDDEDKVVLNDNEQDMCVENETSLSCEFDQQHALGHHDGDTIDSEANEDSTTALSGRGLDRTFNRLCKGLTLGVAYSANIGGTGTLTGTGPNLILSGDTNKLFPESGGVDFGIWFVFAVPAMILSLLVSWVYLSAIFCDDFFYWFKAKVLRIKLQLFTDHGAKSVLLNEYKKLGPWRFAEVQVMILFVLLAFLWLFRQPRFMPGWGEVFKVDSVSNKIYFSDTSTAMFIVFLLFFLPAESFITITRRKISFKRINANETLLDWDSVQHKLPWNVVILLGSGFAIAEAAEVSGLSCWIGNKLLFIEPLPDAIKALTVSVTVACVTEVISNVATTTLFLPILAQLAVKLYINPLYLMIPAAVSASYAFMLPVATPPNAIAFSFGYLKVYDMVFTGILMNILCVFIVNLAINTWAVPLFDLHTFPNWTNTSSIGNCEF